MERRSFLSVLAAIPVVVRLEDDTPGNVQCSICSTDFSPTDEQIVIGASARLIVACPSCRVVQMVPDPEVPD